jgi:hypothetical protein
MRGTIQTITRATTTKGEAVFTPKQRLTIALSDVIFLNGSLVWGEDVLQTVVAKGKQKDCKFMGIERDDLAWDEVRQEIANIKGQVDDGQHRHTRN